MLHNLEKRFTARSFESSCISFKCDSAESAQSALRGMYKTWLFIISMNWLTYIFFTLLGALHEYQLLCSACQKELGNIMWLPVTKHVADHHLEYLTCTCKRCLLYRWPATCKPQLLPHIHCIVSTLPKKRKMFKSELCCTDVVSELRAQCYQFCE